MMRGDFFTKPLQGKLFYQLRDEIMGIDSSSEYHSSNRSVLVSVVSCEDDVAKNKDDVSSDVSGNDRLTYKEALVGSKG